jgi:type I restriction enzyme S subunit
LIEQSLNNSALINLNSSSAQPGINQAKLKSLKMLIPSIKLVDSFEKITNIIVEKILFNAIENKSLSETRDTLLPKLMSGEIRVPIKE